MSSPAISLAARIRIYLTLALQAFPLVGLAVLAIESLHLSIVIIMGLLLLVIVGLILELRSRALGRTLALTGLGVQALGVLTFFIWALIESELGYDAIEFDDAMVILAFLLPLWLWLWNFFAGRKPQPA
jgi:hypothetical protein